ncbi:MAG: hypothetical protein SGCHY_003578 [Lobulomycetales sp.]
MDFRLNEGDVIVICSQYGEIIDIHLARDKTTGKSKGFAFVAYQDQRSTILAVDNLSGSVVLDRKLRVDHSNYKGEYVREGEEEDYQRREAERLRNVLPETLKPEEIRALSKADKVDTKLVELEAQLQDCDPEDPMCILLRDRIAARKERLLAKDREKEAKRASKKAKHSHS